MLDIVRELERQDAATAAAIERVVSLERSLEELRARAAATAQLLARVPAQRERAAAGHLSTSEAVTAAREALAAANEEGEPIARRELEAAERRLADAEAAVAVVELDAAAAEAERRHVDADALGASQRLAALERVHPLAPPRAGLAGALDWSSRARAALFVVRSGLEQERERIVRQAEEFGASLLGEQIYTVKALVDRLS
jgi:hypothetical protein